MSMNRTLGRDRFITSFFDKQNICNNVRERHKVVYGNGRPQGDCPLAGVRCLSLKLAL